MRESETGLPLGGFLGGIPPRQQPRYWAIQPPSLTISVSVMKAASSEQRNAAKEPTSSTRPQRPRGTDLSVFFDIFDQGSLRGNGAGAAR